MRISDWSSDVCSSDLEQTEGRERWRHRDHRQDSHHRTQYDHDDRRARGTQRGAVLRDGGAPTLHQGFSVAGEGLATASLRCSSTRSEEHTSELQSLMRISYAVFCLKKKNKFFN